MSQDHVRRFDMCDETCTVDCGHCKGKPVEALRAELHRHREALGLVQNLMVAARRWRQPFAEEIGPHNEHLFPWRELALIQATDACVGVGLLWIDDRLTEVVAPSPRSFVLPVIPEDVKAVSAREGHFIAERDPDLPAYWHVRSVPTGKVFPLMTGGMLLHDFGPLTEVLTDGEKP